MWWQGRYGTTIGFGGRGRVCGVESMLLWCGNDVVKTVRCPLELVDRVVFFLLSFLFRPHEFCRAKSFWAWTVELKQCLIVPGRWCALCVMAETMSSAGTVRNTGRSSVVEDKSHQGTGCKMPVFPKNKSWCFDAIERVIRERLERGTCRGGFSWSLGILVVGTVALRVRCWN